MSSRSTSKDVSKDFKRKDIRLSIQIQDRDQEILLLVNEMGPLEARILGVKYFTKHPSEFSPARLRTTKERLFELSHAGYLATHKQGTPYRTFFRATPLGVRTLSEKYLDLKPMKAISNLALGTLNHHQRVAWARLALERLKIANGWRAERRLTSTDREIQLKSLFGKMPPYIPDGVYLNPEGYQTVFELEHAAKTDRQLKIRMENLRGLLTYMPERYRKVHFVVSTKSNKARIEHLTKPFGFSVDLFDDLLEKADLKTAFDEL